LTPQSPLSGAFRWIHLPVGPLAAGEHTLHVIATPSAVGDSYELDQAKIVHRSSRLSGLSALQSAVKARSQSTLMALDIDAIQKWAPPSAFTSASPATNRPYW